jgi:RimJ/RimL family protein N-acetyltransferase
MSHGPIPELETARLLLRGFEDDDLDPFAAMCADAEVMRYLGSPTLDRAGAWRKMALHLGHWQLRGYGKWAVVERGTGRLIGRVGLWNPEGWPGLEVGWLLARDSWGRGFATEAAEAALRFAFDRLDAEHVLSVIHPENAASIRVAERLGERYERSLVIGALPVVVYGIARAGHPSA